MIPNGSYIESAKNVSIEGNIITCELASCSGTYVRNKKCFYPNINYNNVNGVLTPDNYENSYFISLGNQLGNCLRIILSGLIIADAYKKHPFICLYDIEDFKEKFIIERLFRQYIIYKKVNFVELDYCRTCIFNEFYGTNFNLINEGRFAYPADANNYGITSNIYSIIPATMSEDEYIKQKIAIYKSLSYRPPLKSAINHFIKMNDLSNCVGVHIRYTDNMSDKAKSRSNFNTKFEDFIKKMNSKKNIIYFVCSDNKKILANISAYSKNKIIFANNCFDNKVQPFYEMNLLANCKSIIGSNSSTFSYESAFLIGTDIELYENNVWNVYNLSRKRPV
jgi:hypothetical protein